MIGPPTRKTTKKHAPATPVCDRLRASGKWNPLWDVIHEMDPAWIEKFVTMSAHPKESGLIDPKTYEFIAIAVDASCTHMYAPGVRRHVRAALELGATPHEILAVLQCVAVLGIHSMALGTPILVEELDAIEHRRKASSRQKAGTP